MPLSRVQYEQKVSGNKNFTVPMPYISRDHIKVSVDGVDVPFSWLNDSTVQLHTAPPLGAIIDVRRETERNVLLVDFQDASTLTEYELDLAALQSFFLAQEAFDATGGTMAVANDGSYSANNRRISNVGYPNSDGDAANVKYVKDVLVSGKDAFEERLLAEAARNKAQQWADENENVQVESGKYSAKHHAAKASQSAIAAAASEAQAKTYRDQANYYKDSASTYASNAASSATAAANSAAEAMSYRNAADSHRQAAAASAAEAAGYAAGVNLPSALGHAGEYLRQREDESGLEYRTSAQMRADLGLGTAATSNVTTSKTDTTSGRVLKVGDFGVGAPTLLPDGTDLNTFTTNGSYDVPNAVNRPEGTVPWGYLRVIRHSASNGYCYQEWTELYGNRRTYYRVQSEGYWSPWREFYHTGNIAQLISDANLVQASRTISTGTGLTGGGNLSANRTISLSSSHIPIGVGQTWQDVMAQRALNTTYTNTTGRPILVAVSLQTSGSSSGTENWFEFYVDDLLVGDARFSPFGGSNPIHARMSLYAIVPSGSSYRVFRRQGGGNISSWKELR